MERYPVETQRLELSTDLPEGLDSTGNMIYFCKHAVKGMRMTGEELLIELHRRGIKQKELAYKLGLTHPMVSYYVRGHQTITPEREKEIRQALEDLSAEKQAIPPPQASESMSA